MALNNLRLIAEHNQLNDRLAVAAFDWSDPFSLARFAGNKFNVDTQALCLCFANIFGAEAGLSCCG